jgi:hypothetical protein
MRSSYNLIEATYGNRSRYLKVCERHLRSRERETYQWYLSTNRHSGFSADERGRLDEGACVSDRRVPRKYRCQSACAVLTSYGSDNCAREAYEAHEEAGSAT